MNGDPTYLVAALAFLLLAVLALSQMKGRGRHRWGSRWRSGRSLSRQVIHHLPFGRKESPAEKRDRLAREFRRFQKDNPGATRMPLDHFHPEPGPSPTAALLRRGGRWVKAQTWGRAVTWTRKNTNPF